MKNHNHTHVHGPLISLCEYLVCTGHTDMLDAQWCALCMPFKDTGTNIFIITNPHLIST